MSRWLHVPHAVTHGWTGWYLRVLSLVLAYGALVHVGNMAGLTGTPWRETPGLWRALDVILLLFDVVVAVGLWRRASWAVLALVTGVLLLQLVPYTLFRDQFVRSPADIETLRGLVTTWVALLAILAALVWWDSRRAAG